MRWLQCAAGGSVASPSSAHSDCITPLLMIQHIFTIIFHPKPLSPVCISDGVAWPQSWSATSFFFPHLCGYEKAPQTLPGFQSWVALALRLCSPLQSDWYIRPGLRCCPSDTHLIHQLNLYRPDFAEAAYWVSLNDHSRLCFRNWNKWRSAIQPGEVRSPTFEPNWNFEHQILHCLHSGDFFLQYFVPFLLK